jgi:hypothetical protein
MSVVKLRLEELIRGLRPRQVVIIGDVMLDHYVKGNADYVGLEVPIQGAGTTSLVCPLAEANRAEPGPCLSGPAC